MPATTTDTGAKGRTGTRLSWFVLLWCGSLAFWILLAYGLRMLIGAAG
jgi:hypothetical protein